MIGIIAAMELEIQLLLQNMEHPSKETHSGLDYYSGRLRGRDVVLCQCGVGLVNAAIHTQILLDRWPIHCLLHTGVAGSVSPPVQYMDLVIGEELCYHDMQAWVTEEFGPLLQGHRSDPGLVDLAKRCAKGNWHVGKIASGQCFVSETAVKTDIAARTGALCVEMESCAVGHTAQLAGVPYVVMRSISDMADGGAPEAFSEFARKAADIAAALVMDMVEQLPE